MSSTKPSVDQHVVRTAFLKKAKRMKKKFFVLKSESTESSARLEYYDSDKKWRNGNTAKKTVVLKECFNINRKYDSKDRYVLALYTKADCLAFCTETEADLNSWLKDLLQLQRGEDVVDGDEPKPNFDHVWEVIVAKKGLGTSKNIHGPYRLCLTARSLKLVKVSCDEEPDTYEFYLNQIRRCGNADSYFFMVVGRSSVTGLGEFWMQSEDTLIAQNMHEAVLSAMNSSSKDKEHVIRFRPRTQSSSASEINKPAGVTSRRQTNPVTMMQTSRDRIDCATRKRTNSESKNASQQTMTTSDRYTSQQLNGLKNGAQGYTSSPPGGNMGALESGQSDYVGLRNPEDGELNSLTDVTNLNRPTAVHDRNVISEFQNEGVYMEPSSTDSDKMNRNIPSDYFEMVPQAQMLSSSPGPRSARGMPTSTLGRSMSQSSSASVGSKVMLVSEWRRTRNSNAGSVSSERTASECSSVNQEYLDMSSPSASWMPGDLTGPFTSMADSQMSKSSGSHTRSSSLCEGEDTVDGYSSGDYLVMTPQPDCSKLSSYVEMNIKLKGSHPGTLARSIRENGMLSSPISGCSLASSLTSGTASAHAGTPPLCSFREIYNLDKVTSYVSVHPIDDDSGVRKTRAYSVGSKLETKSRKKRLEVLEVPHELPRVRSFSMGNNISGTNKSSKPSQTPPSHPIVLTKPGNKSLSAPMLGTSPSSNSWSGTTGTFFKNLFGSMTSSGRSSDILELDVVEAPGNNSSSIDSLSSSYLEERARRESFSSHEGGSRASSTSGAVPSRNKSDSRTSSILGRASGKLASMKKDRKREKLESVPQGRDQDYIEVDCQSPLTEDYVPMGNGNGSVDQLNAQTPGSTDMQRKMFERSDVRSKISESDRGSRSRKVSLNAIPDVQCDSGIVSDYLMMEYGKQSDYMPMSVGEVLQVAAHTNIPEYVNMARSDYMEMQPRIQVTEPDETGVAVRRSKNNTSDYLQMDMSSGTVTPSNASCRNSRTEDEFDDYMEMTFKETGCLKLKPDRGRSLISDKKDDQGPQRKSSKTLNTLNSITSILSRKSSKKDAANAKQPPSGSSSTLPRPTKSAPPSQYASLKRSMSKTQKEPQESTSSDYMTMSQPSPTFPRSPASPEPDYVELAMSPPLARPNSSMPISICPTKTLVLPRGSPLRTSPREPLKVEVQKVKGSNYTGFTSLALNPEVKPSSVRSPETPGISGELFVFETCREERQLKKDYVNMDFKSRKLSEPGQLLSMISPLAMSPIPEKSQSSSVETLTSPGDFTDSQQGSRISSVTDLLAKAATSMQISPKRHCSGDPPVRKTAIPIYRSNSYHPMNKCRSASVLPSLSDIPDRKALSALNGNSKPAKSPPFSIVSGFFQAKNNFQNPAHASRSSSSSTASFGEEEEIKSMIWNGTSPAGWTLGFASPSSQSRPSSTSSDKELNYATLDLPPAKDGQRSRPCSTGPEPCTSVLSYAQIDFTRHEGLKQTASCQKLREKD